MSASTASTVPLSTVPSCPSAPRRAARSASLTLPTAKPRRVIDERVAQPEEREQRFEALVDRRLLGEEVRQERDLADGAPVEYERAVALARTHQLLRLQRAQRLAQRVAVGPQLQRQLPLGWQPSARHMAPEQDLAAQLLDDRLAARAPCRRRKLDWFNHC